jgi:hypothetical protein
MANINTISKGNLFPLNSVTNNPIQNVQTHLQNGENTTETESELFYPHLCQ